MKFFKLTREKPITGFITIKPDEEIKIINISPDVPLIIEFSTTDGITESMDLTDEISLQNSASYLRRSYFRLEVMIANPKSLSYTKEVHCKINIY
jgi:hypothetical protein